MTGVPHPTSGIVGRTMSVFNRSISSYSVLYLSVWFGLVSGLIELLLLILRVMWSEKGFFLRSSHFIWMVPVSAVIVFVTWGMLLAFIGRWSTRISSRLIVGSFVFLTCLSQLLLIRGLNSLTCGLLSAGLAVRSARWIEAQLTQSGRLVRLGTPLMVALLMVLVGWATAWEYFPRIRQGVRSSTLSERAPNIILIVLDTVRADHLGIYGYGRETTPNLAQLSSQGVRFERAISAAPWTLPSHACLFTGRWPRELSVGRLGWLDSTYTTLAEFLRNRGYATAGFVANQFFCGHESGLARGFETYRDFPVTPMEVFRSSSLGWFLAQKGVRIRDEFLFLAYGSSSVGLDFSRKDAATINREFLEWLPKNVQRKPFFAFLNYFDVHDPYLTPEGSPRPFETKTRSRADLSMLRDWQKLNKKTLNESQITLARDAYDDCIVSLDQALGQLIDELKRRHILEDTLLILTADHGEQFGEHGAFGHGLSLYEPEIHVPLLMVYPGQLPAGLVVQEEVSLRDLPATVAAILGEKTQSQFPGRSLAGAWDVLKKAEPRASSPVLSELDPSAAEVADPLQSDLSRGYITAIHDGGKVYIRHGDGGEELYDLDVDPAQADDLSAKQEFRQVLDRCRQLLKQVGQDSRKS